MNKEIVADRIKQLINITQHLLYYSQNLKGLHNKYLPSNSIKSNKYKTADISMMVRFLHCTFYFDALLNLNTLLCQVQIDPNKKEQSIFELLELETEEIIKNKLLISANGLRDKLLEKKLNKWRHKLVGHKDIEKAGDTEAIYYNFMKDDILEYSIILTKELETFMLSNYEVVSNNTFTQMYSKGFEKMLDFFENELKRNQT